LPYQGSPATLRPLFGPYLLPAPQSHVSLISILPQHPNILHARPQSRLRVKHARQVFALALRREAVAPGISASHALWKSRQMANCSCQRLRALSVAYFRKAPFTYLK